MEIYHISDVIGLLGLPQPLSGRSSYYISCPCCDDNPRKRHLNVNTAKDVFRCPRCGVAGGVIDLYSLYTGLPRDDAKVELANKLGQGWSNLQTSSVKVVSFLPLLLYPCLKSARSRIFRHGMRRTPRF